MKRRKLNLSFLICLPNRLNNRNCALEKFLSPGKKTIKGSFKACQAISLRPYLKSNLTGNLGLKPRRFTATLLECRWFRLRIREHRENPLKKYGSCRIRNIKAKVRRKHYKQSAKLTK